MGIYSNKDIKKLTDEQAREWLINNDPEGAQHWRNEDAAGLVEAVRENCESFGYDERPLKTLTAVWQVSTLEGLDLSGLYVQWGDDDAGIDWYSWRLGDDGAAITITRIGGNYLITYTVPLDNDNQALWDDASEPWLSPCPLGEGETEAHLYQIA